MAQLPWMPLYVSDYLADTGHLSTLEHGAYLLLIMHYWQVRSLPNDDRKLARIARMTLPEWQEIRDTLADLFDEQWQHKRIDAELAAASENVSKRSAAGKAGASARYSNRNATAEANVQQTDGTLPSPSPLPSQEQTQEPSPPPEEVPREPQAAARPSKPKRKPRTPLPEECPSINSQGDAMQFWGVHARFDLADSLPDQIAQFRDHHLKLGSTMADWDAAWRTWFRNALKFNPKERDNGRTGGKTSRVDNAFAGARNFLEGAGGEAEDGSTVIGQSTPAIPGRVRTAPAEEDDHSRANGAPPPSLGRDLSVAASFARSDDSEVPDFLRRSAPSVRR